MCQNQVEFRVNVDVELGLGLRYSLEQQEYCGRIGVPCSDQLLHGGAYPEGLEVLAQGMLLGPPELAVLLDGTSCSLPRFRHDQAGYGVRVVSTYNLVEFDVHVFRASDVDVIVGLLRGILHG